MTSDRSVLHAKVAQILSALDVDNNGELSVPEAKVLFADLLQIEACLIPDQHAELVAFVVLSREEQVNLICEELKPWMVDAYYDKYIPASSERPEEDEPTRNDEGPRKDKVVSTRQPQKPRTQSLLRGSLIAARGKQRQREFLLKKRRRRPRKRPRQQKKPTKTKKKRRKLHVKRSSDVKIYSGSNRNGER